MPEAACRLGCDAPGVIGVHLVQDPGVLRESLHERLEEEHDLRLRSVAGRIEDVLADPAPDCTSTVLVCEASLFETPPVRARAVDDADVVLVADTGDERGLAPAVVAGVRGWVAKDEPYECLLASIRCVANGGTYIPAQLLTPLLAELTVPHRVPGAGLGGPVLTDRERQVLSALAEGCTRAEVAAALHVSTNTVRTHLRRILAKLEVHSALTAVAVARRLGLIGSPH